MKGEWLLSRHKYYESTYNTLKQRRGLLLEELNDDSIAIEGLSLQGVRQTEISTTTNHGSKTEYIALTYQEDGEASRREIKEQILRLDGELSKLKNYLQLFESIMAGLFAKEAWLVTEHYLNDRAIEAFESVPPVVEFEERQPTKNLINLS